MIDWKYCPQCKKPLDTSGEHPYCKHCKLTIYQNSKPTASVFLINGDKILLSKRGIEPYKGKYDVIGGFLKLGEDPKKGAIREAREETGLKIKIIDMLGIYQDRYGKNGEYTFNIYYVGKIVGGKMRPQDDVSELTWFSIKKLPKPAFKSQTETFRDIKAWYNKK